MAFLYTITRFQNLSDILISHHCLNVETNYTYVFGQRD
jgi:hypothetical protein